MTPLLHRRVAVMLVWVLALTGSAAAFSACRHGNDKPAEAMSAAMHAGHGTQHSAAGASHDSTGAGCDCGCTCTGQCNHVCHTTTLPPQLAMAMYLTTTPLPTDTRDVAVNPATHPPLRPPTATL